MEQKLFLKEVENKVTTEMVKEVNQLLNQSKTNFLSLGLFLKLPIEFSIQQCDAVPYEKKVSLPELANLFTSTVYQSDVTAVKFIFLYHNEKHLKHILKVSLKNPSFFAFHYVKQLQHVLRNHYTTSHQSFMLRNTDGCNPYELIKLANDISVNNSLREIFKSSELVNKWKEIKNVVNTKSDYRQMSEVQILKELGGQANRAVTTPYGPGAELITFGDTINDEGENYSFITSTAKNEVLDQASDTEMSNLATRVYDSIRSASKGTGGPGCTEMMGQFESVETDTAWFEKLKTSFEKTVHYKTEHFSQTWKSLNNRYRHLFKAPTTIYKQTKIELILSVDQSGSMSELDLQKLLFLLEKNSMKIAKCTVIIHTGTVDKVFDLESDYDITESENWKFMQARMSNGGTSHSPVFQYMEEMNIQKPEDIVYISLSDNYSDIEETINNYPIMRKLTKYWLSPIGSRLLNQDECGGINITMN